MATYKIAWMPGDGVGNDVMEATRIVLDAMKFDAEYIHADIGWEFWCNEGDALPQRTIDILKKTTCGLFGAITSKPNDEAQEELTDRLRGKGLVYRSPIVRLRQLFNLHTNLRPCKAYPGSGLNYRGEDVDLVVFRENTEGSYGGVEFGPSSTGGGGIPQSVFDALCLNPNMKKFGEKGLNNLALSTRIMSKQGCESICRQAFEYAKKHKRKSVTLVEKPNVLRETGGLMTRVFREMAKEYQGVPSTEYRVPSAGTGTSSKTRNSELGTRNPSPTRNSELGTRNSHAIQAWEANIDAICMWLLKKPQDYDVLVAENMFGDIISDLAAGLTGGLGYAASANLGDTYAVFEPTHGSAPKYAGQYKVNPMAMILTAKLMMEWLGETNMAARLEAAVQRVTAERKVGTYDVGLKNSTLEVGEAVARYAAQSSPVKVPKPKMAVSGGGAGTPNGKVSKAKQAKKSGKKPAAKRVSKKPAKKKAKARR